MIEEVLRQAEKLRIENRKLRAENLELSRDNHRYANAHMIQCIENDHMRNKLGMPRNTHPDATTCRCNECVTNADR